jgi:hypothetical protein
MNGISQTTLAVTLCSCLEYFYPTKQLMTDACSLQISKESICDHPNLEKRGSFPNTPINCLSNSSCHTEKDCGSTFSTTKRDERFGCPSAENKESSHSRKTGATSSMYCWWMPLTEVLFREACTSVEILVSWNVTCHRSDW